MLNLIVIIVNIKIFFWCAPFGYLYFSYFFYNEPELGVGIDPGMALTPLPSSIGRGLNPQPSNCELSALLLDLSFHFLILVNIYVKQPFGNK
jgi:hypothetical protein